MIVSLGVFPPTFASSDASWVMSRGSNAILLPPSNAEPAWVGTEWFMGGEFLRRLPLREGGVCSSSRREEEAFVTRRRERPAEDI